MGDVVFGSANFGNVGELSLAEQRELFNHMSDQGCHVITAVECGLTAMSGWRSYGKHEVIFWRPGITVVGKPGYRLMWVDLKGAKIRFRRYNFVTFRVTGVPKPVRPITVHNAPRRFKFLWSQSATRLRYFLWRYAKYAFWLPNGDWNEYINTDPMDLRAKRKARWYASRIDGFAVDPRLVPFVEKHWEDMPFPRSSGHQCSYLRI